MAETGLVENSSESGSSSQSQGTSSEGSTQSNSHHHSTHQQSASESHEVPKHTAIASDGGVEMDEESPLIISHDKRGVPASSDVHSNEDSELSSPPPDDGSSGGEQVYVDERSMHPPPPPYVLSPANMVPVVEHGGFISPGTHPPVLLMTAIQSEGFSSDRELSESPLQGSELRKQLITQLEYYFSKENLSSDKYLSSQMDGDHYVPISIVANFNQVKRLTSDVNLIRDAVTESRILQLDETGGKVRAVPEKRCVLILREIPKNTPKKDITALFASDKCPNYSSCEFADNDCWYITFDSEEDTQKAHKYLREEVREFLGHPIRARIKGTTVQRSSGMPKKNRNVTFPMQPVYNGTPQIPAFYQQPPGPGVVPWPQATSPGYFEAAAAVSAASNYVHFVNNPPQQAFTGPPSRYPNVPMYVLDGEPPVGGRGGARSVPPGGNPRPPHMDRGHSPRPLANGDIHTERDRVPERGGGGGTGGRGQRGGGDHYSGGGGGGRYRNRGDDDPSKKIPPRLNKNRRSNGVTGDSADRGQLPPRQQPKAQNKFEFAQSSFPPLPTSSDNGGLSSTAHPTVTQSQSHMTSSGDDSSGTRPTVSDIVRGKHLKESQPPPVSSTSLSLSATIATAASSQSQASAMPAPPSVTTAATSSVTNTAPSPVATPLSTSVTSTSTTVAEKRPPPPQAAAPASAPPPPPLSANTTPISTVSSAATHSQNSQPQPATSQSQSQHVNSSQISQPSSSMARGSTSTSTSVTNSSVSSSNSGVSSVTVTGGASFSTSTTQTASTAVTASQIVSSGNQGATTKSSQVSQALPIPPPLSTSTTTTSTASTPSSTAPATSISTPSVPVSQSTATAVSRHQPQTLAQTASQVVAMGIPAAPSTSTSTTTATSMAGGGAMGVVSANQSHQTASSRQGPPQPKAQRPDGKGFSREGRPYNSYSNYNSYNNSANNKGGGARYYDRDYQNRSNYRNPQVSKMDNRPFQSNGRGRYYNNNRDRDNYTRRPGFNNHNRSQQLKPSPKTAKKNSAPQAPPPPPTSTTPTPQGDAKNTPAAPTSSDPATNATSNNASNNSTTSSASGANSSTSGASKTEKLSYAQMAQKKASAPPPPLPKGNTATGAGSSQSSSSAASSQTATTPPGTSSGSATLSSSQQQQQVASSKTVSAPTSPQGQQGQMTSSAGGQVPNGSVPSASTLAAKQSNSMKTGKTGLSGSSGQLSAPVHAALTASNSAPASPQKEKLAEAVKSS